MSAKKGNENQLTFESAGVELPREDDIVLYKSKTKQADKITIQDIIEEFDEVKELALNAERPSFSAAATMVIAKAKVLGFMEIKQKTEDKPQRKVIFEVIDANNKKPTNPPTA